MSLETLETVVRRALAYAEGQANFIFQGGEPTLIGLDFYRRIARDYAQRLNDGGALALEVGIYQAEEVAKMLGGARMVKDVCGIERAVIKEW